MNPSLANAGGEKQTRCISTPKDTKKKFDITKPTELHGDGGDDETGVAALRPEAEEARNAAIREDINNDLSPQALSSRS